MTAGKVNVEVVTNFHTDGMLKVRKRLALVKDEAVAVFDLKTGRRTEPLAQQQVANVVNGMLGVNQQLWAQQLAAAIDPQAMAGLAAARACCGRRRQHQRRRRGLEPLIRASPSSAAAPSATSR